MPRKKKTQEKKRESYLKDRRNTYGENAKASRKLIPIRKATGNRILRRIAKQELVSAVKRGDADVVDRLKPRLKRKRRQGWKKMPDRPLGEVLVRKRKRRATLVGRKARTRHRAG